MSWLLIGLAGIDWISTAILVRAANERRGAVLAERASTSVMLTAGATGAAVLGGAYLAGISLPTGIAFLFLAGGLLILSIPQLVWVGAYFLGRFK